MIRPELLHFEGPHSTLVHDAVKSAVVDAGYDLVRVPDLDHLLEHLGSGSADLVLLTIGASTDPRKLVVEVRKLTSKPILIVEIHEDHGTALDLLDMGASDYVCRSLESGNAKAIRELLTRVAALLRRGASSGGVQRLTIADIEVDLETRNVHRAGTRIPLTALEFRLFARLLRDIDRVVPHEELMRSVWSERQISRLHYLRIYISRLRRKLGWDGARPLSPQIRVVRNQGYRIETSCID